MLRHHLSVIILLFILGTLIDNAVEGCSCQYTHPQKHYCNADFVILARIKKTYVTDQTKIYKIRIRKEFKMSEKARVALKSGKITTAIDESLCGVSLNEGELYLIVGQVYGLQVRINLCGFQKPWKEVTARQRKGFRMIYGRGCDCKIVSHVRGKWKDGCSMNTYDCHPNYGICLRSPSGKCNWAKSIELKQCLNGEPINRRPQKPTTSKNFYSIVHNKPVNKNEIYLADQTPRPV